MTWPPSLLRVHIHHKDGGFALWLPLFLIWPPAIVLMVLFSPLVLLLAILLWPLGRSRTMLLAGPLLFRLFCSLRGLEIAVDRPPKRVIISFR